MFFFPWKSILGIWPVYHDWIHGMCQTVCSMIWAWQINRRFAHAHIIKRLALEIIPHSNEKWAHQQQYCEVTHETKYRDFKTAEECPIRREGGRRDGFVLFFLVLLRWLESRALNSGAEREGGVHHPSGYHHSPQQHQRHRIPGLCFVVSNLQSRWKMN